MTPDDTYETPFQTDEETQQEAPQSSDEKSSAESELTHPGDTAEADAAQQAWDANQADETVDDEQEGQLAELAQPFVGLWNTLVSTTNWEKGRIISQWREALIESGVDAHQYSDEAWARRVGGVTAPHVGRLRRVHDRFSTTFESYNGLYWSHFLAALDWEDAPMWLEGATREGWSVAGMREQRWQAEGAVESKRPTASEIVEVDTDEDVVLPAQGGGRTKEYGDEPGVASGPLHEDPDFGDGEELMSLAGTEIPGAPPVAGSESDSDPIVQPFAGLPELPDDLADAFESLKLAVLRHKTSGWADTDAESIQKYLEAFAVLMRS
ncbi:MAG: hypothetical protein ACR2NZ_07160 [Rubripirellula sp.]